MKIAIFSFYSGSVNRGGETFVSELASRLSQGHEVDVFQGKNETAGYSIIKIPADIDWSRKDMTGTIWRRLFVDYWSRVIALFTLKALPWVFRKRYDIVVALNGGWQPAVLRIVTWLYGGKLVVSGQSGMGWDDRNNLWSFPNTFIALTRKAERWAKKANPFLRNIQYIPNGVDLLKFTPEGKKIDTKLTKPIVLCVGAFTKQKRIDLVIRAVAKLKNVSLLLAGDGELKESLESLGKKLLGERFEIVKLDHKLMPTVYRAADLFTLVPEVSEAFGIVYVEAMATNLPVVAVKDEQRQDIVGDAGILVDPENLNEYAEAIQKALGLNWGERPRRRAKKFDWDSIALKYEKLFLELIK
jgi:glycosyltransferase involved in cell wall biosynthesis